MRRRLIATVAAVVAMVLLAMLVPMAFLVQSYALEDRLSRLEGGSDLRQQPGPPMPERRGKRSRRDPLAHSQRRIRELEAEIEELRESKSWKLTAPLRSLGSLGRKR